MPDDSNCTNCGKTGFKDGEICRVCYGQGILPVRYPFSHLLKYAAFINDIFLNLSPTCKVAGCIDSTEYFALSDAAKDGVKIVLSCGFVDMRDGQWARNTLWAIFGAQSVTRAALIAMFG